MNNRVEILAPAGNMECLDAAVKAGAHAVYLGGKQFGARATAGNFAVAELSAACRYAHLNDVKVYATVNTLIKDEEFAGLHEQLEVLCTAGVDALIVQDIGVLRYIRAVLPSMPLHASTQMTVQNAYAIEDVARAGIKRVVLPRELSLADIASLSIVANCLGVELEVFVHGALCYCISGQCLMSSMIGGRSGNRGRCAQPCRTAFDFNSAGQRLVTAGKYPLSPKDINCLELLPELIRSGVSALKIEGRMKPPDYVYTVVRAYRAAWDAYYADQKYTPDNALYKVFNRGFDNGYARDNIRPEMMSWDKPNNRGEYIGDVFRAGRTLSKVAAITDVIAGDAFVADVDGVETGAVFDRYDGGAVIKTARPLNNGAAVWRVIDKAHLVSVQDGLAAPAAQIALDIKCELALDRVLALSAIDNNGNNVSVQGTKHAEVARSVALSEEKLLAQLDKLGGTNYFVRTAEIKLEDGLSLPLSEINEVRRHLVSALEDVRLAAFPKYQVSVPQPMPQSTSRVESGQIIVATDDTQLVHSAIDAADALVLFVEGLKGSAAASTARITNILECIEAYGARKPIYVELPQVIYPRNIEYVVDVLKKLKCTKVAGFYGGLGSAQLLKEHCADKQFFVSSVVPLFNTQASYALCEAGAKGGVLSAELTLKQIRALRAPRGFALETVVYGAQQLMLSPLCLAGLANGGKCGAQCSAPCASQPCYELVDKKGEKFPVRVDQFCRQHIFNCRTLDASGSLLEIVQAGVARLRLDCRLTEAKDVVNIIQSMRRELCGGIPAQPQPNSTRGHYFRGVE